MVGALSGILVPQCNDEATQVISTDGGDVIDTAQKSDKEGQALLGVDDGALAVAAGAGVEAVAGKQSSGGIQRQGKWSWQT